MRPNQADPGEAAAVLERYDAARGEETDPARRRPMEQMSLADCNHVPSTQ